MMGAVGNEALPIAVDDRRVLVQPGQPFVIGRDPAVQFRIDAPLVSRRHAEVTLTDDGWVLRDLGSSNGTYVDGKQVQVVTVVGEVQVRLGDADEGPVVLLGPAPGFEAATTKLAAPEVGTVKQAVPQEAGTVKMGSPLPAPPVPTGPPSTSRIAGASAPAADAPRVVRGVARVAGRAVTESHDATGRTTIGRNEDNDIVLRDLNVSRKHAEVRQTGNAFEVVDLGSANGTYLNGQRITRAALTNGDMVAIGRHQFTFEGTRLHETVDNGPVSMVADDLMVRIGDAVLLDDVSFALPSSTLLAVIGPSGCGKSTLVRAMTGLRPASQGTVRYDGRDLYAHYAELRYRIGVVPQDDVLHRQLTVRRALRFSAALRFANDVPRKQRHQRVDEVLQTLGLTSRAKQRIDTLSGGQRKRTSVALELLTEPSLLFLDEPTSGLDPALDKEVMTELRQIADSGRTVTVVTHSVLHLDLCDRVLVMCLGGTMGYFGPPDELLAFFGAQDYADVFEKVTEQPDHWTRKYRGSELYRKYVLEVMEEADELQRAAAAAPRATAPHSSAPASAATAPPAALGGVPTVEPLSAPPSAKTPSVRPQLGRVPLAKRALHPFAPLRQFLTLCVRMFTIIVSDRGYALFLLGLPLALALITRTVPGKDGLAPPPPTELFSLEAQRLIVVLIVGAAFLGIATAIREIVNESTIYRRERAVGLSPGAYLGSKVAVFAVINTIQCILFVYLSLVGRGKPASSLVVHPPLAEIMVAVAMTALACTGFGLLFSALVKTTEQTTPILVVSVMGMLVLSGGLFELNGQAVLNQVSWLSPTRWGFASGAGTVDLQTLTRLTDPLWAHTVGSWWRGILILLLQTVVFVGLARITLRRHEPGRY
jgi:ABC-type multidrug transport system ATPase subunit/pSer/pThr/pTyr-binding forkhead associated (FHA) protein